VATHDERIIEQVKALVEREGIGRDRFEFQMLYGVRPALQRALVGQGYKVLVATPFGPDWYPYLMRRLAERPANVWFVLRNLLRR
jgi:proline dehydrogenase